MTETIEEYVAEINGRFDDGLVPDQGAVIEAIKRAYMIGVQRQPGRVLHASDPLARGIYDPIEPVCAVVASFYSDYLEQIPDSDNNRYYSALDLAITEGEVTGSSIISMIADMHYRHGTGEFS